LELAGRIPGRFPTGGSVEGEDEAAARACSGCGALFDFGEEGVEL